MTIAEPVAVTEARDTIKICEAAGLYAGPIYRGALETVAAYEAGDTEQAAIWSIIERRETRAA